MNHYFPFMHEKKKEKEPELIPLYIEKNPQIIPLKKEEEKKEERGVLIIELL